MECGGRFCAVRPKSAGRNSRPIWQSDSEAFPSGDGHDIDGGYHFADKRTDTG